MSDAEPGTVAARLAARRRSLLQALSSGSLLARARAADRARLRAVGLTDHEQAAARRARVRIGRMLRLERARREEPQAGFVSRSASAGVTALRRASRWGLPAMMAFSICAALPLAEARPVQDAAESGQAPAAAEQVAPAAPARLSLGITDPRFQRAAPLPTAAPSAAPAPPAPPSTPPPTVAVQPPPPNAPVGFRAPVFANGPRAGQIAYPPGTVIVGDHSFSGPRN